LRQAYNYWQDQPGSCYNVRPIGKDRPTVAQYKNHDTDSDKLMSQIHIYRTPRKAPVVCLEIVNQLDK